MNYLLLGNGVNIANGNSYLAIENVQNRFLNVLEIKYKLFEKCLYIENLNYKEIKKIF